MWIEASADPTADIKIKLGTAIVRKQRIKLLLVLLGPNILAPAARETRFSRERKYWRRENRNWIGGFGAPISRW